MLCLPPNLTLTLTSVTSVFSFEKMKSKFLFLFCPHEDRKACPNTHSADTHTPVITQAILACPWLSGRWKLSRQVGSLKPQVKVPCWVSAPLPMKGRVNVISLNQWGLHCWKGYRECNSRAGKATNTSSGAAISISFYFLYTHLAL